MGWRISLYCVPKKTVEKYKDVTQEEYNKKWDIRTMQILMLQRI